MGLDLLAIKYCFKGIRISYTPIQFVQFYNLLHCGAATGPQNCRAQWPKFDYMPTRFAQVYN